MNHDSANLILNELYESDQENFSNNRTRSSRHQRILIVNISLSLSEQEWWGSKVYHDIFFGEENAFPHIL